MDIRQLEYAVSLWKTGSFTKAAKLHDVTQPALSYQIKKLEEELNLVLFIRDSNEITSTEDGTAFLSRAEELVASTKDLARYASEIKDSFSKELTIGIIPTLSPYLVPLFIKTLNEEHPEIKILIKELLTEELLTQLMEGDIDFGIAATPIKRHGVTYQPLFYEQFFVYSLSEQADLTASEMLFENLWLLNEGNCFRDQVNDICSLSNIGFDVVSYSSDSIDSLIRMVESLGGTTILPELTTLALGDEKLDYLVPIEDKVREVSIITRKKPNKERTIHLVENYIRNSIPSRMLTNNDAEIVDPGIKE